MDNFIAFVKYSLEILGFIILFKALLRASFEAPDEWDDIDE